MLFVPTGEAAHKRIDPEPGSEVRLEMARSALAGDERFRVSDVEIRRTGASYVYETLEQLEEELDQEELVLVIGADQAAAFSGWRAPERIAELARIGVATRPGTDAEAVDAGLRRAGVTERAQRFDIPAIDVSSTMVRERVGMGLPVRYLVPDGVADLIEDQGLYR